MRKLMLAAGVATLAMTSPALADRDKQGGQGNRGGQQAKAEYGRGGPSAKVERDNRGGGQMQAGRGDDDRGPAIDNRGRGNDRQEMRREARGDDRRDVRNERGDDRRDARVVGRAFGSDDKVRIINRDFGDRLFAGRGAGLIDGCPPGLDKKDNGCLPPGQARKLLGARIQQSFANSLVPNPYRSWYRDNDQYLYRTGDGFIYQVNRSSNLVDGIIPLFGGGGYYAVGDPWPQPYDFYNVPHQYRDYYADTSDYRYRYGDGAIYRVNSGSGVVDGIVALLAGDLGVGSNLPAGYDTYNVPFAYRDRYYDTADNWYRYNDGYIYQVDPKTRLISAVIDAIV